MSTSFPNAVDRFPNASTLRQRNLNDSTLSHSQFDQNLGDAITALEIYVLALATSGGAKPAGITGQVQFNSAGDLGADATFTFSTSSKVLAAPIIDAQSATPATVPGQVRMWTQDSNNANAAFGFKAPVAGFGTTPGGQIWTLPQTDAPIDIINNQSGGILVSDGAGNLGWTTFASLAAGGFRADFNANILAFQLGFDIVNSVGTVGPGFGSMINWSGQTTAGFGTERQMVRLATQWRVATDASRVAAFTISCGGINGSYNNESLRCENSGNLAAISFLGANAVTRRSGDIGTGLVSLGLFSATTTLGAVNAVFYGADPTGVADSTAAIISAIAAAKRVYLPAGNYTISGVAGNIFASSVNGLEIFGDGVGKTIITYQANQTLTGAVHLFNLTGRDQSIHDLSIVGGSGLNGALVFPAVNGGGINYANGDTITLAGGVFSTAAVVQVTSNAGGVITGISLVSGGSYTFPGAIAGSGGLYSQGSTSGSGSGATLNCGAAASPQLQLIAADLGCWNPKFYRLDLSGAWGLNTAGGAAITTFQPAQQNLTTTTLGTAVTAGVVAVTPGSMAGIYPGLLINIGGSSPETLNVTSVSANGLSFTATFANNHLSTDPINYWSFGAQFCTVEDVYIHDCMSACGTIINSCKNAFINVRVLNVGMNQTQHAHYVQTGQDKWVACDVEGAAGFSWQINIGSVNEPDATGNVFIGCSSKNPGLGHLITVNALGNGTDPEVPSGTSLLRWFLMDGCRFKVTKGGAAIATGVSIQNVGGLITNCFFEDAANSVMLNIAGNASAGYITSRGNTFRQTNSANANGLTMGNNATSDGDTFLNFTGAHCIAVNGNTGNCIINDAQINFNLNAGVAIQIAAGNNITISNVTGNVTGNFNTCLIKLATPTTGLNIYGCNATLSGGAQFFSDGGQAGCSGTIHDNIFASGVGGLAYTTGCSASLDIHDNAGVLGFGASAVNATALTSASGRLLARPKGTGTYTGGLAVNPAGTANSLTTDTVCLGVATSNVSATNSNAYVAGAFPGSIIPWTTDGTWVAGNIGILSTTTGGAIHDSGLTTVPASGSYGQFLNAGSGVGTAQVLILEMVPVTPTAGRARNTADRPNATAVMSNLTDMTMNLLAGRKYTGRMVIKGVNSTATEGIAFDFNGGSATMTNFFAVAGVLASGGTDVVGNNVSAALATAITFTTLTGETGIVIEISLVCNAAGTFIPRFAEATSAVGTATVRLGSFIWLEDSPN